MSSARRRNYSPLEPAPPYPAPKASPRMVESKCQALDTSVYLAWEYSGADADTLTGYMVRISKASEPATVLVERFVTEPDTDTIIDGLANGTAYIAKIAARNPGGEGQSSAPFTFTPAAPIFNAPTLKTLTAGDGQAIATWSWPTDLPAEYAWDWMSFEAVNEVGSTVTEHVTTGEWPAESGALPLTNDHDWKVALVAVAHKKDTGKQYVSALSNTMTVHTEKPLPPYKPRLTGAQIAAGNNGQIDVSFTPGIQNVTATRPRRWWHKLRKAINGPGDIDAWQVRVTKDGESSNTYSYDVPDGSARSFTTPKVQLGTWIVDVRAKNTVGWSAWSNGLAVTYKPTDTRPFTADRPFGTYESAKYSYAIFDPGNDPKNGWSQTWKCTFTGAGQSLSYEILIVGAGGGGKGQTATLGKGGNGGGGQLVYDQYPSGSSSGFTVTIGIGGSTAIDPQSSTLSIGGKDYTASAGKSSSSGTDATGSPRALVRSEWLECFPAFGWLEPDSNYVGGVAQDGKQGFPNGLGWGCAGAGTKNSNPGRGVEGIVIVRWAKG